MTKVLIITTSLLLWSLNLVGQEELLEVESGIQLSQSIDPTPDPGTIRWTGNDFEGWNGIIWVSLTGNVKVGTVTDIEGNSYKTITIGTQEWMTENLRTSQYNDGTVIDQITSDAIWEGLSSGAWCWYGNNNSYEVPYGKLYNWYAVNTGNLCPTGWHVPTDTEWTILIDYLDPDDVDPTVVGTQSPVAGGKMKETGVTHWNSPNTGATNESGWSGLPGGTRNTNGSFNHLGTNGYWWSASEFGGNAWIRLLSYNDDNANRPSIDERIGVSVRCLRD